ncbi:MAG: mandelate racemase/muconate lactonizing enzyme family protein [Opitutaceae bacterium]|nr:mandelate racemase/muconate lactonizing enzyme family protein [Opitutaceae bacterium]
MPLSSRRHFVGLAAAGVTASALGSRLRAAPFASRDALADTYSQLDTAAALPVLDVSALREPLLIESIEFLQQGETYLVRVRTKNGATGVAVGNERDMSYLVPVAKQLMVPALLGKDAREWENLIETVYLHSSNYKRQGLLFWLPFAAIEFAVLDLLSRTAGVSVSTLLGGKPGGTVDLYHAHEDRHRSAAESVDRMLAARDRYKTRAAKFKVGGRMRGNADVVPGRTEALIPLVRERFGDRFTLYGDSNGSFDFARGLEVGRLLDRHGIAIYEEPVPHDLYDETKRIADALTVPLAGGEQESSHNRFRWMIAHRALDVVQPDLFYFGGLVRSIRVARMAHAAGLKCDTHISGTGLGFLYMLHFVACIPNAGAFQEYKSFDGKIPLDTPAQTHTPVDGRLRCPTGPGFGIELDPKWLAAAKIV